MAFELADVEDKQDVKGNEVDIAAYETERQEALDQLKQEIKDAEEYSNTLKEKEYTKESWKAYKDAIKEAKDMVEKSASKDEYLAMIQKLADAKTGLEKVNQPGEIRVAEQVQAEMVPEVEMVLEMEPAQEEQVPEVQMQEEQARLCMEIHRKQLRREMLPVNANCSKCCCCACGDFGCSSSKEKSEIT